MRRAGALLVAVAMVAAAFLVRDRVSGDDDGDVLAAGRGAALLCPVELEEVCRSVTDDVEIEVAGDTADRLVVADSAEQLGARAWVVPAAWARLVTGERSRLAKDAIFAISAPVASAPVAMVTWDESRELRAACGGEIDWTCIGVHTGETFGDDRVRGGGPPVDSATGLTVAASQVADLFGSSDYAANDFDLRPEIEQQARRIAAGVLADPIRRLRTEGRGLRTAVGALAVDVPMTETRLGTLVGTVAVPARRADVVLVHPEGHLDGTVRRDVGEALIGAGWLPPADGPDGLPTDGSVLAAVRTLWKENQR